METIKQKAKELLESGDVKVVIGYGEGTDNTTRAIFVRKAADADQLIYDNRCVQNLATYLLKHEVKHLGKAAIVANESVIRSILQVASEYQLADGNVCILAITNGQVTVLNTLAEAEAFIKIADLNLPAEDLAIIAKLDTMSIQERFEFWKNELSRCVKCYACRSSCPMCYCNRCMVEVNQPQWITVEATPLGNYEWHLMRAMHLAGRCVNCGECGRACPLNIPIHLLTYKTVQSVKEQFDVVPGLSATMDSTLSSYKTDDKENFIR